MVIVDDDEAINPYPGYPLQGGYRIDGQTVDMESDTGEVMAKMFLREHNRRHYLLTSEQRDVAEETGYFDECALTLGGMSDN